MRQITHTTRRASSALDYSPAMASPAVAVMRKGPAVREVPFAHPEGHHLATSVKSVSFIVGRLIFLAHQRLQLGYRPAVGLFTPLFYWCEPWR
jgi:hypothetical protein